MRYTMLLTASLAAATAGSALAAPVAKKAPAAEDNNNEGLVSHPQLTLGLGYLSSYMPVGDVSFYGQVAPRLSLGVSVTMGMQVASEKHIAEDNNTAYSTVSVLNDIAAKGRYFLLDSLYVTGGLGMRTVSSVYNLHNDEGNSTRSYVVRSFVPSLAIGSQWHLGSSMLVGIDWAGFQMPLAAHRSSSGKTEIPSNDTVNTSNPRDIATRNRADKLGKQPNWILGLVQIGWLF